jgi:hypothetical protein
MESNEQYHKLSLSEIEFLPKEFLIRLLSFNIFTVGQLLGATRGLTNTSVFDEQKNQDDLINQLLQFIPAEIIETYRNFAEEHPTGLLKLPENENN